MSEVPKNVSTRKPTPKKSFSLADFKKKIGGEDVPEKALEWIKCSKAFQDATGLPGFPKGYVSLSRGFTNTGKSTSVCEAAVSAQKAGILPILIDTENNMGRMRLSMMGFDWTNDFFIEVDNDYLLEHFGKAREAKTREATIEDLGECIHYFLDLQDNGELPHDLLFVIDSLGTLDCNKSVNAKEQGTSDNNMWNANAFERAFKSLINNRIPSSRKSNKTYTNTLIAVQKIWLDSMSGGQPVVKHKGGEAFAYGARLIFHHGGTLTHGTKKIVAESTINKVKKEITFGIETKISVVKNQVDGELGGIAFEGKLISTPHGFIGVETEDKAEYKSQHIKYFREVLGSDVNADDMVTKHIAGGDDMNVEEFNSFVNDL